MSHQWKDPDINRAKPKLPVLPPLVTSRRTPERNQRVNDRLPIGWSQVTQLNGYQNSTASPASSTPDNFSPVSVSSRGSRRPPPPAIVNNVLTPRDNKHPVTPNWGTPTKSKSYKSPFVGEEEIERASVETTKKPEYFRSPFIGDSSVLMPSGPRGQKLEWINDVVDLDLMTDDDAYAADTMKALKALPPLPPKRNSANSNKQPPPSSNTPTLSMNTKPSSKDRDDFYEPIRPFTTHLRTRSDTRAISDSISSYYSNSNYAFNDEAEKHRSFNSIAGSRPLQQVPSVTVPTQPFSIDLLDENKLYQCYNVSLLSDIYEWLLKVYFEWFNEYVFHKIEFYQVAQLLLEFQLPVSCDQDIVDSNVDKIIESLVLQGAIRFEGDTENPSGDEITIIVAGLSVQGVLTGLLPCYSFLGQKLQPNADPCCYSPRCPSKFMKQSRPVLKVSEIINKSVGLWTDYWKLSPDQLAEINPKEVKRQSFIFDLIMLEERSLNLAYAAVEIYGRKFKQALLPRDPNFKKLAFDIFEPMIELHKEYLLTPIFWKLQSRGKFIDGVGKFYLQWCNAGRDLYLQYAEAMATVHEIIKWEKAHGTQFSQWLRSVDDSPEISRSKMYHDVVFFGGFFKALQNIPVTLSSILKCTDQSMEDFEYLKLAISEVESLNSLVDRTHGNAIDQRKVVRFSRQLIFGSGITSSTIGYVNIHNGNSSSPSLQEKLDLRLNEKSRRLLKSGIVFKKRDLWLENTQVYLTLLDNYLLISEVISKNNETKYKLSERPIPIDYLSLEAKEDCSLPSLKSSETRQQEHDSLATKIKTDGPVTPVKSNRRRSLHTKAFSPHHPKSPYSHIPVIQGKGDAADSQEIQISFKVRNTATNESFTFSTNSIEERDSWVASLVSCFKIHQANNNHRVFTLTCLADMFSYEEGQAPINLPVAHEGSAIDCALKTYYSKTPPSKVDVSADVRCAVHMQHEGRIFTLCATSYSIFMASADSPNSWKRILTLNKTTRLQVNNRLGLLFVLTDRKLCYFNIPSIICTYYGIDEYLPEKQITGIVLQEKVGYFKMTDDFGNSRQLFYERKGKITVLTPEFDRLTKRFKYFKYYKEYRMPGSSNGLVSVEVKDIAVFAKSFIVCSSKGALLFNESFNDSGISLPTFFNDKSMASHQHHFTHHAFKSYKETYSKLDSSKLKMAEYVKTDILNRKTTCVACFQLSDDDFVIIYDEAVLRINRNGEIPDWKYDILVLDFYCSAASFTEEFLILFGENLVQIYDLNYAGNILNNKISKLTPVQIIKGKKIKLLHPEYTENPIMILSHPSIPGRQLVLEFKPSSPSEQIP